MLKVFFFAVSLFLFLSLRGQGNQGAEKTGPKFTWGVELKAKYGFLVAHRPIMSHIPKEHTKCVEANIFFRTKGKKSWQKAFKHPLIGVGFVATSTGNKELMGNQYGTFAFLQYPFLNGKKAFIYGRVGCGIGFAPKVFDQLTNPKNIAISSHVNAMINFSLFYQYRFGKNHLNAGLDLTHFSNGASKMPNLGVNLPYFALGFGHQIKEGPTYDRKFEKIVPEWNFLFVGVATFRDAYPTGEHKYPVLAASFLGQRIFTHGKGFETGLDLIYKPSIRTYKPVIYKSDETIFQAGIYTGYVMTLDKLQISVGMGAYLLDQYNADDRFYHRVGMRYKVSKHVLLNLTLKSHWAKADYLEYGIGYRF